MYPLSVLQPAEVQAAQPLQQQHENPYPRYYRETVEMHHLTAYSIAPTLHATISVAYHVTNLYFLNDADGNSAPISCHTYHHRNSHSLEDQTTSLELDLHWVLLTTMQAEMVPPEEPEEEGVAEFPQSPARFLTPPQMTLDDPIQRTHPLRHENAQLS